MPKLQASGGAPRARVLIVDDDSASGISLCRLLKPHEVTVVTDAREAVARLASGERYDLILCDLMMPGMTGMALHAELARTTPEQADRMTFVTGGAFTPTAIAFLDRVPNERFEKPFEIADLLALVRRYAESAILPPVGGAAA
jgi:CheY-like chemotaxis protein